MKNHTTSGLGQGRRTVESVERLRVFRMIRDEGLPQKSAAAMLGLSKGRVSQLYRSWLLEGDAALNNHRFGLVPANRISDEARERYVEWHRSRDVSAGRYSAALSQDRYEAKEGVRLSAMTARRILTEAGEITPKEQQPVIQHPLRLRMPCFGQMIQADASPRQWMKGLYCNLIVFVDDATSRQVQARFVEQETTLAYLQVAESHFREYGVPESFYTDRHSVFYAAGGAAKGHNTRFSAVMKVGYGVEMILSNTPQARGRGERAHRGNQLRLPMMLTEDVYPEVAHRIQDRAYVMDACNRYLRYVYLPDTNKRHAQPPMDDEDKHRPLTEEEIRALPLTMTELASREMDVNGMFRYENRHLILADGRQMNIYRKRAKPSISIYKHWNGSIRYFCDGKELQVVQANTIPRVIPESETKGTKELTEQAKRAQRLVRGGRPQPRSHPLKNASFKEMLRKKEDLKNRQKGG